MLFTSPEQNIPVATRVIANRDLESISGLRVEKGQLGVVKDRYKSFDESYFKQYKVYFHCINNSLYVSRESIEKAPDINEVSVKELVI
jgi:hypothetical protein